MFFHFPISHTSSELNPRALYMRTPAPRVEWGPQSPGGNPKAPNILLVKLPMELEDNGAKGGRRPLNKGEPAGKVDDLRT